MKVRNKGKVYPSPSSSSSPILSSYYLNSDSLSVLKLLPAAILALASVLSLADREVLAYMVTRAMKSPNPSSFIEEKTKNHKKSKTHMPPVFDCECFDCYTSYWFRWDSSPNRELINQAIEAFEEHLNNGEQSKRNNNNKGKKREKMGRRLPEKPVSFSEVTAPVRETDLPEIESIFVQVLPEKDLSPVLEGIPENGEDVVVDVKEWSPEEVAPPPEMAVVVQGTAASNHKGLARKVLPDVLGLFNSRLWTLWSPKV